MPEDFSCKETEKIWNGSRQIRRHEKTGRSPARRLIDSGDLRQEERRPVRCPNYEATQPVEQKAFGVLNL